MRVAFVGTGQIGTPMADRLLAAGHDLTVYARRAEVRDRFAEKGAAVTDSLADAARRPRSCTSRCTPTTSSPKWRWATTVSWPTSPPTDSSSPTRPAPRRRSEAIAEAGNGHVVDAPFSGAAPDIEAGHLTVMLGGAPGDVGAASETISAFGDPIVEIGALGSALVVKLLNNALLAANMQLAVQADALANDLGIETAKFAPVILASSGASYAMGVLSSIGSASKMIERAGHYLYKDAEVVQQVLGDLGIDLGIIGEVIERGPAEFQPR